MITLIGSGNVATWIAQRMQDNPLFPITQVYSRKLSHAKPLAEILHAQAIDDIALLNPDNQVFIFALADKAYTDILPKLPFRLPAAFLTSGTLSCQCLKDHADRYGVIYPLQTFTKTQDMRTMDVPLCLEYHDSQEPTLPNAGKDQMHSLARQLSPLCYDVSESQRARLHLAAVFSCNFSNAMYNVAYKLLQEKDLPFEMLIPLLQQTVQKLKTLTPAEAQTGPAARRDMNVMQKQMESIDDPEWKEIYRLMSELIMGD